MSTSELLAPWNPYQNRHVCTACGYMFLHDVPQSHYESVHHKKAPGYLRFSAIRGNPWHFKGMHWSSHHESE